jgi:hypothetical protein
MAGTIADVMSLFSSVNSLGIVRPNQVEDCVIFLYGCWCPEAALIGVLIKLQVFGVLPV